MGAECSTETSALDWGPLGAPPGVLVIRVDSDGCAAGRLRVSDNVLCINGVPVSGHRSHRDAMSALESSLNSTGNVAITIHRPNVGEMIVTIHKARDANYVEIRGQLKIHYVCIGLEFQGYNLMVAAVRPVEKPVETPVAKSEGHAAVGALEIVQCILYPFAFCAL